jgi:4-hydroxy-2-oxoheptanedioate aldolase
MDIPHNALKRAIRDGKSQIGLWSSLSSNYTVEVIAGAGFDWILLDTEHSPNDLESVLQQAQAAAAYPVSTVARVPWNDMVTIKRFLDIGIQTLLIPYVCSVAEAKDAVRYTRYPPAGVRGVAGSTRATRFGRVKDYAKKVQDEICVWVQVETKDALDQLEDICAVDGVDGVFIGPADLPRIAGLHGRDQQAGGRVDDRGSDAPHPQVRQGAGRARVRRGRHPSLHRGRRALHGCRLGRRHPRARRRGALRQIQGLRQN